MDPPAPGAVLGSARPHDTGSSCCKKKIKKALVEVRVLGKRVHIPVKRSLAVSERFAPVRERAPRFSKVGGPQLTYSSHSAVCKVSYTHDSRAKPSRKVGYIIGISILRVARAAAAASGLGRECEKLCTAVALVAAVFFK